MSQAVPQDRGRDARVSLGVPELDAMLEGGLMPHRPYLIVGPSGTGKTTLALQFLCAGIRRGEKVLYVTLEDPPNEVRWNHRALRPELDRVDVFDAIPDVMRYERVPFKDISAVRQVVPFQQIPDRIRITPEFTSVEVTGTALEQMLRSEVQKRGYSRLVIDSLTALQYFCMKGFDPTVGAQTFLRFLTDLRTTTLLTVEAPLEDVETPERMLARGEVRLFRWELEGATVRAIGVEKFRGSAHDVRLHPYRLGTRGIDVQIAQTISRDTRRIVEPAIEVALRGDRPSAPPTPAPPAPAVARPSVTVPAEPLSEQIRDLVTIGVDVSPLRSEVEAALQAIRASKPDEVAARVARISAMAISLAPVAVLAPPSDGKADPPTAAALQRILARADRVREGRPPTELPAPETLGRDLATILALVPPPIAVRIAPTPAAASAVPPTAVRPPEPAPAAPAAKAVPVTPRVAPPVVVPEVPAPAPAPPHAREPKAEEPAPAPPVVAPAVPSSPPPSPPRPEPPTAAAVPPPSEPPRAAPSAQAVARAAALLGEPTAPAGSVTVRHSTPPAGTTARSSRAARAAAVPPLAPPPPLPRAPTVTASPAPPPPVPTPSPSAPAPQTAPAAVPVSEAPAVASPPPTKRRRRAAPKPSVPPIPAPEGAAAPAEPATAAAARPRRRVTRRKKAPPVVAATPVTAPAEPTPAAPPPTPVAEAADPPPSSGGS